MGQGGERTDTGQRRRRRTAWTLALCAGLVLGQPVAGRAQTGGGLPPSVREPICQLLRSVQASFAGFPGAGAIFTSLLQSFGCAGGPSGTTTTTTIFGPTTTTSPPGSTTTAVPPTTVVGPTSSTTPTTLPPCIPNNPVTTTVPCVPVMPFLPS